MRIGNHDTDQRVLIIAEVGNNHEGQYDLAEEMIESAARAGADAVKFQTIVPERLVSPRQTERIAQLKRFQLSDEDFARLSQVARRAGVLFISTPFDLGSVAVLEPLVAAYKVSSGDNNFLPLLDRICRTDKPILISAGLTDWAGIKRSCDHVREQWRTRGVDPGLAVLHCVSAYPVPPAEANLAVIGRLQALGITVGYSDHTLGVEAAVLSVAAGARIVEEHFTVDKNYSSFHDHQLSADPADMQELVRRVREVETLLGQAEKRVLACEESVLNGVRRSIVAARDLAVGQVVSADDLNWLRPGGGLPPGEEARVVGRKAARPIAAGDPIPEADLTQEADLKV